MGPGVTAFKEGDEVICQPSGYCGVCRHCRVGNTHYCENAFTTGGDGPDDVWDGAFAEYMLTTETCLFRKRKELPFDAAALTEPLSGAWKGVIQYSEMQVGDDVVVIGVGSIELLCLMVAAAAGAGTLVAIDPSDFARKNALALGGTKGIGRATALLFGHFALAPASIRVNGVLLGWFDTEGERAFYPAEQIAEQSRGIPAGRAGEPTEAAKLAVFLASPHASYATGSLIRLDGGFALKPDPST